MIEYPRKVLLAADGSEDSDRAARAAVALAARPETELHVVHVGRPATPAAGATAARPPLPGEPPGYAEKQARKLLEGQAERVRELGGAVTGAHLRMGHPAAEVVSLAARLGADMVVVGVGGPRLIRRAVAATTHTATLGAAAEEILRTAPCPVLVARGDAIP